jgi:hypothetical protein
MVANLRHRNIDQPANGIFLVNRILTERRKQTLKVDP